MNYNFLENGLLTEEQLKKISYLSFSTEAKEIISLLTRYTRKLKMFLRFSLYLDVLSTLSIFLLLVFSPIILQSDRTLLIAFAFIFFALQVLVVVVRINKNHYLNNYSKIITDLGDNLISFVLGDYRLSLGEHLPDFPQIHYLAKQLGKAAESIRGYFAFMKEFTAILVGSFVLVIYSFISQDILYKYLSYEVIGILTLLAVYIVLEGMFSSYEEDYTKTNEMYDRTFQDTQPLLTRTEMNFDEATYRSNLNPIIALSDNINAVGGVIGSILPIILLIIPIFVNNIEDGLIVLLVGLYVSSRLFAHSGLLKKRMQILESRKRLDELDWYLDIILEQGSEVTPSLYKKFRKEYLDENPHVKVGDRVMWGDLNIEGLSYISGRDFGKRQIYVDKMSLPYGKVSIMIGDYGIGKSLFGRLLTLRYTRFNADGISIGDKDLRTFKNLDIALKYLHFSALRNISTSYRNALSSYFKQGGSSNIFVKKVFSSEVELDKVKNHFVKNKVYYKELNKYLLPIFDENPKIEQKDYSSGYLGLVSELFRSFSSTLPIDLVLKQLKEGVDEKIINKGLVYAAIAEFIAYEHLKTYVTEVNVNYMDADLSKPPISKEMKLRFLYAIDVFVEGLVFVVDEPFSNMDQQNAKRIFADLVEYAKTYNAVVLILDEKIYSDIIEEHKNTNVLGKMLTFEDDGFSVSVRSEDLE